jgi:hypothetical protein
MSLVGLDPRTFIEDRARPYAPRRPALGWPFWLLLALFLVVMTLGLSELWLFGHHGWNGARRGMAGINYVRHGFLETRFGPVENFGPVVREQFSYYWHHPVLIHVLTGVSFTVFGVHEWAARLVPIALSTLTFVLLYVLALRWWGRRGAVATALTFTFLPLEAFYGKMVNHEPLVLALGVTLAWLLVRFHEARRWRHVIAAGLLALLGSFSDWPFFLMLAVAGLFELTRNVARWRRDRDLRFLAVLSVAALVGAVAVVYYLVQFSGDVGGFKKLFSDRSGGESGGSYGPIALWSRRGWYWELFGPIATLAGAAWLLAFPVRAGLRRLTPMDALIGASFLVGAAWLLLFTQAASIHEYWAFYLVPFLALSSAWLLLAAARAAGAAAEALWRRARAALSRAVPDVRRRGAPALAVLAAGLAAYVATGTEGLLARQRTPSDVGQEAPEFRFRNAVFGRWLGERLRPDDRLLYQDGLPLAFQLGFYLRVNADRVAIGPTFRQPHVRPGHRWLVVDRQRLPEREGLRILSGLARRYPVTMVDRFALFDVAAPDNADQRVRAFRFAFGPPSPWFLWFESMVYPPVEVVESPADAFLWARHLDLDEGARRLAARLERPPVLRAEDPDAERRRILDWIAWYDAARLLGRATLPATAALRHALGTPVDLRFGDVATLEHLALGPYPGGRVGATPVLRILADGDPGAAADDTVTMRVHHRPAVPFPTWRRLPFFAGTDRVWRLLDPPTGAWRAGSLVADTFPVPDGPFPRELVLQLERRERSETRRLGSRRGAARDAVALGEIRPDPDRRHDPDAPFAWLGEECQPRLDGGVATFDRGCRLPVRKLLDLRTDLTLTGDDTLRVEGVRFAGSAKDRAWYQLFLRTPAGMAHDWTLKVAVAKPRKGDRPPGYFADLHGRVSTAGWRPGDLVAVTIAAVGTDGPYVVWLKAERTERQGGRVGQAVVGVNP